MRCLVIAGMLVCTGCTALFSLSDDGQDAYFSDSFDGGLGEWILAPDDFWTIEDESLVASGPLPASDGGGTSGFAFAERIVPASVTIWQARISATGGSADSSQYISSSRTTT